MKAETLLREITEGKAGAFELLYTQFKGLVFSIALSVVKCRADAEDLCADTFLAIFKNPCAYRGGSGKQYIATVARNKSLDLLRKRRRETLTDFAADENMYSHEPEFNDSIIISAALKVLGDDERQITLMYNGGLKHREIAKVLNMPLGTVTYKYKIALKKMRDYLEGK